MPGRVAPGRSGRPPRAESLRGRSEIGRSVRGRSDELLCGRDVLLPEDGFRLEEVPDVERDGDLSVDGRLVDGREDPPLDGGRRDSISKLHSEWENYVFA